MANALKELFEAAMKFRLGLVQSAPRKKAVRIPRYVYRADGRPAQRYLDPQNRVRYRPWVGPTGGAWVKGQSPSASSSPLEK